jgi:hypothetical protein
VTPTAAGLRVSPTRCGLRPSPPWPRPCSAARWTQACPPVGSPAMRSTAPTPRCGPGWRPAASGTCWRWPATTGSWPQATPGAPMSCASGSPHGPGSASRPAAAPRATASTTGRSSSGTVALSDHPVWVPPLRHSNSADHGHDRVVRALLGALRMRRGSTSLGFASAFQLNATVPSWARPCWSWPRNRSAWPGLDLPGPHPGGGEELLDRGEPAADGAIGDAVGQAGQDELGQQALLVVSGSARVARERGTADRGRWTCQPRKSGRPPIDPQTVDLIVPMPTKTTTPVTRWPPPSPRQYRAWPPAPAPRRRSTAAAPVGCAGRAAPRAARTLPRGAR